MSHLMMCGVQWAHRLLLVSLCLTLTACPDDGGGGAGSGSGGSAAAKVWGTAALLETLNVGGAQDPQIAINASGHAVAVWKQSDGAAMSVYANYYTAGTGWGTAALIETDNAGEALDPQVAVDASGNAVAVWEQSDGTRTNILANRYVAGTGWARRP